MELLIVLLIGFIIIGPIVALIKSVSASHRINELESLVNSRLNQLSREIAAIEMDLGKIERSLAGEKQAVRPEPPKQQEVQQKPAWNVGVPEHIKPEPEQPKVTQTPPQTQKPEQQPTAPRIEPKLRPSQSVQFETKFPAAPPIPPATPTRPPVPPVPPTPPRPEPRPEPQPAEPVWTWARIEENIGRWIAWVAGIFVLCAVGFFLKYAFDQNWITAPLRVGIGFAAGAACLGAGVYFNRRDASTFSQGLMGTGIAILYLSAYATNGIYDIASQITAIVLMSIVTIVSVVVAVKCDNYTLSILALIGGFLTPVIFGGSGGKSSDWIGLFSYIAILDAGLLAVAAKKDHWAALEPMALIGTYGIYLGWYITSPRPSDMVVLIPFLTTFWALFYAIDVYRNLKSITSYPDLRVIVAVCNSAFFYGALYAILNAHHREWLGFASVMIGAAYFITALVAIRRHVDNENFLPRYILTAITLLVIATSVQYSGFTRMALWAVEALALTWAGLKWNMKYVWGAALGLFALSVGRLLLYGNTYGYETVSAFKPLLNSRFAAFSVITASLALAGALFSRSDEENGVKIGNVFHYTWYTLIFLLLSVDVTDYFRRSVLLHPKGFYGMSNDNARGLILSVVWAIYALPLTWYGLRRQDIKPILYCGAVTLVPAITFIAVMGSSFDPIANFKSVMNLRSMSMISMLILLLVDRWIFAKRRADRSWIPSLIGCLDVIVAILGFELFTVETIDYFRVFKHAELFGLSNDLARDLILSGIWTIYSLLLVGIGVIRKNLPILWTGIVVAVFGICSAIVSGITFEPIKNFTLVANFRTLVLGVTLLIILAERFLLARRKEDYGWILHTADILAAAVGFEILTVEILGYFHKLMSTPGVATKFGMSAGFAEILTLSAVWAIYSVFLSWIGIKKGALHVTVAGLVVGTLSIIAAAFGGLRFNPLQSYTLLINYRAAVMILVMALAVVQRWLLTKHEHSLDGMEGFTDAIDCIIAALGLELLTVEALDFFRMLAGDNFYRMIAQSGFFGIQVKMARDLVLAAIWSVYSLLLIWYGFRKRAGVILYSGMVLIAIAVGLTAIKGFGYSPINNFTLGFNLRAVTFVIVTAVLLLHRRILVSQSEEYNWVETVLGVHRVVASLLVFELLSVETWDLYSKALVFDPKHAYTLNNMRQLMLSLVWIIYSFGLMVYGIWRRAVEVRFVAIAIFGVTIVKVFFFDLAFLDKLYRIISFLVLGLILFATSYLYQHYKSFIFGVSNEADAGGIQSESN